VDKVPADGTERSIDDVVSRDPTVCLAVIGPFVVFLANSLSVLLAGYALAAVALIRARADLRRDPAVSVFLSFCIAVTTFAFSAPEGLKEKTAPITGWNGGEEYGPFILIAVVGLAFGKPRFGWVSAAILVFYATLGFLQWWLHGFGRVQWTAHPISSWRPAWTVLLPLAWALWLAMSRLTRRSPEVRHA
jgi:hypothetical protein